MQSIPELRIDKKLNLVVPVDTDSGTVYVHSTPISREVFETYYRVLGRAFADIFRQRLEIVAGPRLAMLILRDVAREQGEDVLENVEKGLIAEIHRLTNVAMPMKEGGWNTVPFQDVLDQKLLSEDDVAEVEGVITFFTLASAMFRKKDLPTILNGMASLWGARVVSSTCSEYVASLPRSTEETTSPTTTSLVPS